MTDGGTYLVDDMHTSDCLRFSGGFDEPANFFNTVRHMVDDMHNWYHGKKKLAVPELAKEFNGVHIHDSIVVLDKASVQRPTHSRVQN